MEYQPTNSTKSGKNFRQKKYREKDSVVFDYNIYKLLDMIGRLDNEFEYHPDVEALCMLLDMYKQGVIDVTWQGGWPMADVAIPDDPEEDYFFEDFWE